MRSGTPLDAAALLRQVAENVPPALRDNVVVIGSIAAAWAFRGISGTLAVATKDIDLLLQPAVDAVTTAERLGEDLLDAGWTPQYPNGIAVGTAETPVDQLPALRLTPPGGGDGWFVELLGDPPLGQSLRRDWRRLMTPAGHFGLPSFRYLPVAVHGADETEFGLRVARPARMALAHLLEHADPDRTPISSLAGNPPRFVKDVGRAVALYWLAREQPAGGAGRGWRTEWQQTLQAVAVPLDARFGAAAALEALQPYLREAHAIARASLLAPHGTSPAAFARAHYALAQLAAEI